MDMLTNTIARMRAEAKPVGVLPPAQLRAMDTSIDAFCEIFDDPAPAADGPLSGLSFAVKEVIDQTGRRAGWGLPFLQERRGAVTASAVAHLAAAGAVSVGVTRSTQLAIAAETPTRNPWGKNRSPGGSSAGSAAAVAAGMVDFAIGTQTVGSILRPAAYCGVIGFKPGYGVLPTDGAMVLSATLDHLGFLARNLAVTRAAFSIFATDTGTSIGRVLVPRLWFSQAPPVIWDSITKALKVANPEFGWGDLTLPEEVTSVEAALVNTIVDKDVARNFSKLIAENRPLLPPELLTIAARGQSIGKIEEAALATAQADCAARMAEAVPENSALLLPAAIDLPPRIGAGTGLRDPQRLASLIGWPAISLPLGLSTATGEALPFGVQLLSKPGSEYTLLSLADRLMSSVGGAFALRK